MAAVYTTRVRTHGGRNGHVEAEDGLLKLDLAMPHELGGPGGKTNPEQLFAAGYAACFDSAARFIANKQNLPLADSMVDAIVSLHRRADGYRLQVAFDIVLQGLDQAQAEKLVAETHQFCPYSCAVQGNVDVQFNVSGER